MLTLVADDLAAREAVRKQHQLTLVSAAEDGLAIAKASNGLFGFTTSPCEKIFPLMAKGATTSYEIHKRRDGAVFLLGYTTKETSAQLAAQKGVVNADLYPSFRDGIAELVLVPREHCRELRHYSQRIAGALQLEVDFT